MAGIWGAIDTSATGLTLSRTWMDAVSDNIANINTARPTSEPAFQERFVQAQAADYGTTEGVQTGVQFGNTTGRLVSDPGNPMADAQGMVRYPDIDLGDQMTQLLMAQRSYQANLAVVERAKAAYENALELGK
jgi:flagellar basal-body rod protein FlgC